MTCSEAYENNCPVLNNYSPNNVRESDSILVYGTNKTGFTESQDGSLEGLVSHVHLESIPVEEPIGNCFQDTGYSFNLSLSSEQFLQGLISSESFEGAFPDDNDYYHGIAQNHNCWLKYTAYSVIFYPLFL